MVALFMYYQAYLSSYYCFGKLMMAFMIVPDFYGFFCFFSFSFGAKALSVAPQVASVSILHAFT
jgi:hypothetical protein